MRRFFKHILNNNRHYFERYLLLFVSAVIVLFIIPKKGKFKYEYEEGKPWMHEDLTAPFTFAILKNPAAVTSEQNRIVEKFKPFYERDSKAEKDQKNKFISELSQAMNQDSAISVNLKKFYLSKGLELLGGIYDRGVINMDSVQKEKSKGLVITELKNNVTSEKQLFQYYTLDQARNYISNQVTGDSILKPGWFLKALLSSVVVNINYNKDLSDKKLEELLSTVSATQGIVKQDEKIIGKGSMVTPERFRELESLKNEYESNIGKSFTIPLGYFILIASMFLIFGISLELFRKDISESPRSLILILINILLFTAITAYLPDHGNYNFFIIPYCIVPIILMAFFGLRIGIITHLFVVFLCALIVSDPFEFILVESFAGIAAVLTMAKLRYISQFFISAIFILFTYCLVYSGISLIKISVFSEFDWRNLEWFGANFVLTLLAYPLVYANETIFGFLSDISLIELSDVNNKLIKELFQRAPGTFQHSIQVSNLVESVMDGIGGNALLARVGALYHDIGKLHHPEFFIENQPVNFNPHENIDEHESAAIIIGHVKKGVELARKNRLPKQVTDFIRTHHGTTRVEYFYSTWLQGHESVDETDFRYPGPKPSSKEMAVLMMVDSVEAASRTLQKHDDKEIENLVDQIIDSKINDRQFDNASITIQEINAVRRILKKLMKSIYHIRIQYPAENEI